MAGVAGPVRPLSTILGDEDAPGAMVASGRATWAYALPPAHIATALVLGPAPALLIDGLDEIATTVHLVGGARDLASIAGPIDLLLVGRAVVGTEEPLLTDLLRSVGAEVVVVAVAEASETVHRAIAALGEPSRQPHRFRLRSVGGVLRAVGPADATALLATAAGGRNLEPLGARLGFGLLGRRRPRSADVELFVWTLGSNADGPPRWLAEAAAASGSDVRGWSWALATGGAYRSQKLVWYLAPRDADRPDMIVKQTRSASDGERLRREFEALTTVGALDLGPSAVVPRVLFLDKRKDRPILGETAVEGVDLRTAVRPGGDDPALGAVLDWLTRQALETRRPVPASAWADALGELLRRCHAAYGLTMSEMTALRASIARLDAATDSLPAVFGHGDAGAWNVLATSDGRIAPLDWEGAEAAFPPAWDLIYFLRSYALSRPRFGATSTARHHLIDGSRLTPALARALAGYADAIGIPRPILGDLFHTCWMHRAVKEAARLPPVRRHRGAFVRLLRAGLSARRIALVEAALAD